MYPIRYLSCITTNTPLPPPRPVIITFSYIQIETGVSLDKNTIIRARMPSNFDLMSTHTTIKMLFKTKAKNGLLLYIGPDKSKTTLTVRPVRSLITIKPFVVIGPLIYSSSCLLLLVCTLFICL